MGARERLDMTPPGADYVQIIALAKDILDEDGDLIPEVIYELGQLYLEEGGPGEINKAVQEMRKEYFAKKGKPVPTHRYSTE